MQHSNSALVCRLTGEPMTGEGGQPMVLPDGEVYSHKGLAALAEAGGASLGGAADAAGATFAHPRSGQRVRMSSLRRAYFP